jgi:glycosyltransferase involved in cell wall biosynthesis
MTLVDKKVTVLHLTNTIRRGGAERQLYNIVIGSDLVENLVGTYHFHEYSYFENENSDCLFIITGSSFMQRYLSTRRLVRISKPDVVYAWSTMPYLYAMLITSGTKVKLINGSIRHGVFKRSLDGFVRLIFLHMSKHIVANSVSGLKANRLKRGYVLYNGVGERFNRANYHTGDTDNRILSFCSVANLVPYKDYGTVFKALASLKMNGVDFVYYIIGDGPLREDYLSLISECKLENNVVMLGRVINPEKYLLISDIFIHSSKGEGCSNAILEAMSMGLPVIASDTGGTSEIVGDNAILFPYQDNEALLEAIVKLVENKPLRREMGDKSQKLFMERFSLDRMLNDYHRIISDVVAT